MFVKKAPAIFVSCCNDLDDCELRVISDVINEVLLEVEGCVLIGNRPLSDLRLLDLIDPKIPVILYHNSGHIVSRKVSRTFMSIKVEDKDQAMLRDCDILLAVNRVDGSKRVKNMFERFEGLKMHIDIDNEEIVVSTL